MNIDPLKQYIKKQLLESEQFKQLIKKERVKNLIRPLIKEAFDNDRAHNYGDSFKNYLVKFNKAIEECEGSAYVNPAGNRIIFDDGRNGEVFDVKVNVMSENCFDLVCILSGSDRSIQKNLTTEGVVKWIKETLKPQLTESYVKKALAKGKTPKEATKSEATKSTSEKAKQDESIPKAETKETEVKKIPTTNTNSDFKETGKKLGGADLKKINIPNTGKGLKAPTGVDSEGKVKIIKAPTILSKSPSAAPTVKPKKVATSPKTLVVKTGKGTSPLGKSPSAKPPTSKMKAPAKSSPKLTVKL